MKNLSNILKNKNTQNLNNGIQFGIQKNQKRAESLSIKDSAL
ncbi:hypothetical protein RV14_GL001838 [Enterococcus ratti]|uniref:Uncharacterized protein n=1 Tax=Enterococcus ratti TaxID=150033 RepID=A0A1L8WQ70_9ENTE|nr:hypothetical protein RV14_GL001838 [Enterococcus ratti]